MYNCITDEKTTAEPDRKLNRRGKKRGGLINRSRALEEITWRNKNSGSRIYIRARRDFDFARTREMEGQETREGENVTRRPRVIDRTRRILAP